MPNLTDAAPCMKSSFSELAVSKTFQGMYRRMDLRHFILE
ncbi:hypothetical protein Z948_3179 [Sulfitobacter donghicola DSW-25 = KCTC 12864 = JCM 14565]|nr:hypothetical protein Z948_3179 [Sulfitobacter donghicola DSW-25 = KCTC 12864 = JCM 14565]